MICLQVGTRTAGFTYIFFDSFSIYNGNSSGCGTGAADRVNPTGVYHQRGKVLLFYNTISGSAYGLDLDISLDLLKLPAQVCDVGPEHIHIYLIIPTPDLCHQFICRENTGRVSHQAGHQLKLFVVQPYYFRRCRQFISGCVQTKIPDI